MLFRSVAKLNRDELACALLDENIETKKYFFPALHRQKLYADYQPEDSSDLKRTELISEGILSLPIYESLPDETVEKVALAIRNALL